MTDDPAVPGPGGIDEDAAWRAIVADLSQDPTLVRHTFITPMPTPVPEPQYDDELPYDDEHPLDDEHAFDDEGAGQPPSDPFIDALLDDAGADFEPPDPGPLELPHHPVARFAWAGALGGPAVLMLANVLHWGSFIAGLGVAAGVAGFVTLIARHRDERDDDFTDGAVL